MIRTRTAAAALLATCLFTATASTAFAQEDDGAPQRIPNSVKYQDSKPNAKGAGTVGVVETRALLSRDGSAALEITTGNLDTGEPSTTANITKVQLKIGGSTTNFNHLDEGSSFTLPLTGVQRLTPFEAHVNVKGLNGGNTEVVKVDDMVRLRPDVRIESIDAPGAVRMNQPFTIIATLRERNGDSGARTNCILQTDTGVIVDRADGIWVDAGDSVQCMFSQTLDTLGRHVFFVKLAGTQPLPWTPQVQSKSFTVLATTSKQWELTATQRVIQKTFVETSSADPDHPNSNESTETNDRMHFSAVVDQPIDLDTMTMFIEETTDGKLIYRYDPVSGFLPGSQPCRLSDRKHAIYQICRFEGGVALDAVSSASNALYVSYIWVARFDPASGQNVYTRRTITQRPTSGPLTRYGSTYSLHITLSDAASHFWEVVPFINLVPYDNPVESTTTYHQSGGDTLRTDSTYHESGKTGSASQD